MKRSTWLPVVAVVVAAVAVGGLLAAAVRSMTPARPVTVARPVPPAAEPAYGLSVDADDLVIAGLKVRLGELQDEVKGVRADLADTQERLLKALARPWVTQVKPRRPKPPTCPAPPAAAPRPEM